MTCGNYKCLLLDSCFVNRLRRVDNSCELLDFFGLCSDAICVIKGDQYAESPCNDFKPNCTDLDDIFTDEEAMYANLTANIDFTRISRDPSDAKIFLWAYQTDKAAIWTCDKNLLDLCRQHNISRCCFKAAIKIIDDCMDGAVSNDPQYNTKDMQSGDDPFYHYDNHKRCESHCGLITSCICFE